MEETIIKKKNSKLGRIRQSIHKLEPCSRDGDSRLTTERLELLEGLATKIAVAIVTQGIVLPDPLRHLLVVHVRSDAQTGLLDPGTAILLEPSKHGKVLIMNGIHGHRRIERMILFLDEVVNDQHL